MVGRRDPFSSISTTGRGGGQKQGAKPEPTSVPAVDNAYETTIAEKRDRDRKRRVDLLGGADQRESAARFADGLIRGASQSHTRPPKAAIDARLHTTELRDLVRQAAKTPRLTNKNSVSWDCRIRASMQLSARCDAENVKLWCWQMTSCHRAAS